MLLETPPPLDIRYWTAGIQCSCQSSCAFISSLDLDLRYIFIFFYALSQSLQSVTLTESRMHDNFG
jgi:hypothetical protein